jgi:hypothetical protein
MSIRADDSDCRIEDGAVKLSDLPKRRYQKNRWDRLKKGRTTLSTGKRRSCIGEIHERAYVQTGRARETERKKERKVERGKDTRQRDR